MKVETKFLKLKTSGNTDIIDITSEIQHFLSESGLEEGTVTVSAIGSTASVTTCEFEPGLVKDLKALFEELIPANRHYCHDEAWHDGNGHSHLRASLVGPSKTFIFSDGKLCLGTWQQIIFIDFDARPRQRKIVFQFSGR
ncbi:MAG: secondary thiamine-phosphate synthase enzyme YjbQ [Candidatus Omnitrophica bacterium]|nr:secondary thiamine-phosphate synthase enzyme YjbQ [Candidatus Omnitrophota bacterium]